MAVTGDPRREAHVSTWDEPLSRGPLRGKTAKALAEKLDLHTLGDLLRYYPRRYDRRGDLTDLAALREGEEVTVQARVLDAKRRTVPARQGRRRMDMMEATVTDGTGRLHLTFFNRGSYHQGALVPGRLAMFSGRVSTFKGRRQLDHPQYELLDEDGHEGERARAYAEELIPVYPAVKGLDSTTIARTVDIVLADVDSLPDPLPPELRERRGLLGVADALRRIHRPAEWSDVGAARRRLKWDEAFVLQLALAQRRHRAEDLPAKPRPGAVGGLLDAFDAQLPFTLTEGQREVGERLAERLDAAHPMHCLLQGDVGAGKTLVALRAMLRVVDSGGQAVMLAPTEVLAQQHHRSISAMLGALGRAGQIDGAENATRVALLTGSMNAAARREALLDAASGAAGIVVGTHALLQEHVSFADLGLVVVDEQHRFGVEQRDALREKAVDGRPHVLVMTATPIPRTVAMTVYGDLDVVALTQLPTGRAPVSTHVVPASEKPHFLARAWERIREEAGGGHQAFVVCPRIGDDAKEEAEEEVGAGDGEEAAGARPPLAVLDVAARLREGPLSELRVEVLHGRMAPDDKDAVMRRFSAGDTDAVVSTTVIEVGVDVPNATVMVIMDADRFGVSQLHQLRGRVGRGQLPGLCLLVTDAEEGSPARERLAAVAATTDGFELSRVDLEMRREGDVLGDSQSGARSSLRMLTLLKDEELIGEAREEATAYVAADPGLTGHPPLAQALETLLPEERAEYLDKA
ncbi:ATP-dependent DNA helicase recG [Nocardiopsis dassonvillei]|uniref:Probable DNA 3'-5' helicase RecG n=1 Tax=Nocardiopsis dassonvillei (strain ATCC 23218 / DSM 43111 / CIP 107115 / JCM 7437 / KCTC 9190 / NBRC 14626 / NCTC 10488 / NRRL B-5397 / IMRU 509) TaxID=446468 RepID=D7AU99_NOCDD|nr:DEAD/DEAH box helicase domain protein [Nocardiopsis dassonvillei subsp. dassonvillei DSM 43111]VEI91676.1 ATP-dependent DNA helicase recG [Nocardiopsis dassonvillei]